MFKQTDDLPECILEDINEERDYTQRDNVFHASELCYTCMWKQYMDRQEGKKFDDQAKWNIYRGRVFDNRLTKLFDENEVRVQQRIRNTPFVIRGRIDGLNYADNCIYEIKTVQSIKFVRAPFKHHVPQGLFYLHNYDPNATLKFIYISMDGYKVYTYQGSREEADSVVRDMEEKAKVLGTALIKGEAPDAERGNECKWCRYKAEGRCPIMRKPRKKS